MLKSALVLLVFLALGEGVAYALHLPVPGPVIGMGALYLYLSLRGGPDEALRGTAHRLLKILPLLFIPAGAGVIDHLPLLRTEGLAIVTALLVSTALAMAVTGWVLHRLLPRATEPAP
ncbi:MAG TPA: CidA/LrgA family protein [Solimonas sp.]|nr:CidA/LrgA family protein [Solimonas sp.]